MGHQAAYLLAGVPPQCTRCADLFVTTAVASTCSRAIAGITLPLTQGDPLPVQFDPIRQAWIVISVDMNLRITGHAGPLPVAEGGSILGFGIFAGPSFMQVACRNGRYFLRDSYHRAFWLLSRGITIVPAFVREFPGFEELVPDPGRCCPKTATTARDPSFCLTTSTTASAPRSRHPTHAKSSSSRPSNSPPPANGRRYRPAACPAGNTTGLGRPSLRPSRI
jgi:hypothetical protein